MTKGPSVIQLPLKPLHFESSLSQGLREKQAQPETAVLGHKQVIAEWTGETHRLHEMRFL